MQEVKARLPHVRYGWGVVSIDSPDGRTFYLGALSRPGTDDDGTPAAQTERWRSKPLFVRCYQRTGGPVRVEAECKKLSGVPLRDALQETCAVCAPFLPGRCGWTEIELPPTASKASDQRVKPAKLVRQAYGLLRAAALRSGHLMDGRKVPVEFDAMWGAVVYAGTGLTWGEIAPKVPFLPPLGAPGGVTQGSEMADAIIRPVRSVGLGSISQKSLPTPLGDFYTHFCGED